jgi:hypothetical protein
LHLVRKASTVTARIAFSSSSLAAKLAAATATIATRVAALRDAAPGVGGGTDSPASTWDVDRDSCALSVKTPGQLQSGPLPVTAAPAAEHEDRAHADAHLQRAHHACDRDEHTRCAAKSCRRRYKTLTELHTANRDAAVLQSDDGELEAQAHLELVHPEAVHAVAASDRVFYRVTAPRDNALVYVITAGKARKFHATTACDHVQRHLAADRVHNAHGHTLACITASVASAAGWRPCECAGGNPHQPEYKATATTRLQSPTARTPLKAAHYNSSI